MGSDSRSLRGRNEAKQPSWVLGHRCVCLGDMLCMYVGDVERAYACGMLAHTTLQPAVLWIVTG